MVEARGGVGKSGCCSPESVGKCYDTGYRVLSVCACVCDRQRLLQGFASPTRTLLRLSVSPRTRGKPHEKNPGGAPRKTTKIEDQEIVRKTKKMRLKGYVSANVVWRLVLCCRVLSASVLCFSFDTGMCHREQCGHAWSAPTDPTGCWLHGPSDNSTALRYLRARRPDRIGDVGPSHRPSASYHRPPDLPDGVVQSGCGGHLRSG